MNEDKLMARILGFLTGLPFVGELGIEIDEVRRGFVSAAIRYQDRFSAAPGAYPAAIIGALGDVAAMSACLTSLDEGQGVATFDYFLKMISPATGERLIAEAVVLSTGRRLSVARSDIYAVSSGGRIHCATLLATSRNSARRDG